MSAQTFARSLVLLLPLGAACEVVPPESDAGSRDDDLRFGETACYRCSRDKCAIAVNACATDVPCATWLTCVAKCPSDDGVSARNPELNRCGLPSSAAVLFQCIQDYSSGFLLGCEAACTPVDRDD